MSSGSIKTRRKILHATAELLRETGDPSLPMSAIAQRAGVSRQALYLHFDSKIDLFLAVVEFVDEEAGLDEMLEESKRPADPVERLKAALRVTARYAPEIHELVMVFDLARRTDEAAAAAWNDRMAQRREELRRLLEDVGEAGRLAERWSLERAVDAIFSVSEPRSYATLVEDLGWTLEEYESWLIAVVDRVIVTED